MSVLKSLFPLLFNAPSGEAIDVETFIDECKREMETAQRSSPELREPRRSLAQARLEIWQRKKAELARKK